MTPTRLRGLTRFITWCAMFLAWWPLRLIEWYGGNEQPWRWLVRFWQEYLRFSRTLTDEQLRDWYRAFKTQRGWL